jgi:pilus assembly protein CpaE
MGGTVTSQARSKVVVVSADADFAQAARDAFAAPTAQTDVELVIGRLAASLDALQEQGASAAVTIIELDPADRQELASLQRLMKRQASPVVVVLPAMTPDTARQFLQLRVADFLIKPVAPPELYKACVRVVQTSAAAASADQREAQIVTFLPAVGGAGVTTVAIQSALLLLEEGGKEIKEGKDGKRGTTCLVDLDFQHGACCDYLDLEPRLDLTEIAPRPERLDRQLLEVMISYHKSGLAVIAAPNKPAEMRVFDPELVTRLLDLVSTHFDHVVIDMPRTWFAWTDSVLLGSNRVFIVSEMTVPSVKQAKQLTAAIRERLGEGPRPQVIVNRFEQRMFGSSLRRADIEQALAEDFAGVLPNDYGLVREAIDRGVPLTDIKANNRITAQLRKLVLPAPKRAAAKASGLGRLSFSWAR